MRAARGTLDAWEEEVTARRARAASCAVLRALAGSLVDPVLEEIGRPFEAVDRVRSASVEVLPRRQR